MEYEENAIRNSLTSSRHLDVPCTVLVAAQWSFFCRSLRARLTEFVSNYIVTFSNSFSGVEVLQLLSRTSGQAVSYTAQFIININFAKETLACMIGLLNNGMRGYCFDQITWSFNEEEQCESNLKCRE